MLQWVDQWAQKAEITGEPVIILCLFSLPCLLCLQAKDLICLVLTWLSHAEFYWKLEVSMKVSPVQQGKMLTFHLD